MTKLCVCGIGLFSYLTYVHFCKNYVYWWLCKQNIMWLRENIMWLRRSARKRKRCNRISSKITLGRNYPSAGYQHLFNYLRRHKIPIKIKTSSSWHVFI